jgi:outer membrane protein insertion porin family
VNELLGENCKYRDVHIEIEETGTGNFGAFFGYSTAEDLFCGINVTEKNFNYRGLWTCWQDGFSALRGGGEYLSLNANIGQKASSYGFSWTQPFYKDTPWSIGFDADRSWNSYISDEYEIESYGFAFHASYPLDKFTRFGWHYRMRNSNVFVSNSQKGNEYLMQQADLAGLISASGVSLIYDSTDSASCPTNGFRSKLELEYAGLGGDHHFWSFAYLNTFYYPVCKKGVIKLRADARYIMPSQHTLKDQIPIDERLFLGGDNQVRGYRPYAIGPKFPGTTDPAGGVSLTLFSAEYNRKIFEKLDAFLFFDAGELSSSRLYFGSLNYSAGYGIRLKVFEGAPPVCLGMGYPLNAESRGDIKRFFWTLGGRF